jgi:hypothetical protein
VKKRGRVQSGYIGIKVIERGYLSVRCAFRWGLRATEWDRYSLAGCGKINFTPSNPPQMYQRFPASEHYERHIILGAFLPAC